MARSLIRKFEEQVRELGGNGNINLEDDLRYYILKQESVLAGQGRREGDRTRSLIAQAGRLLTELEKNISPAVRESAMMRRRLL